MSPSTDTPEGAPPPRGRRRLRWLGALVLVLVVLMGFAPTLLSPFVAGRLERELSERTGGRAEVGEVSLGWTGSRASGVTLDDADGRRVLGVRSLDARYDLLALLTGAVSAQLDVDGVDVHLRREADGRWNLERIAERAAGERPDDDGGDDDASSDDGAPPSVTADVRVRGVDLHIHAPEGETATELRDVAFTLEVDALDEPAPFDVALLVAGPGQPDGARLTADGSVTARGPGGTPSAALTFDLEPLSLSVFAPLLAALGVEAEAPEGSLRADGRWDWRGGFEVDGRTTATLSDARATVGGETLTLPFTSLAIDAALDASGSGTQTLTVESGDLFAVDVGGEYAADARRLTGTASARGALGELLARSSAWVDVKADVGGRWSTGAAWDVSLDDDLAPRSATADLSLDLSDLSASGPDGAPIDLGELTSVHAELSAESGEGLSRLDVPTLVLRAGPVSVDGRLGLAGLKTDAPTLRDSQLTYTADLGRLTELVGRVVDLGELSLRGTADGTLAATSDAEQRVDLRIDSKLAGVAASGFDEQGRAVGPIDATLDGVAQLDASGATTIESFTFAAPFADLSLSGRVDPSGPTADVALRHRVDPAALDAAFGAWLPVRLAGAELSGELDVATTQDDAITVDGVLARGASLAITLPGSDDGATPARTLRTSDLDARTSLRLDVSGAAPRVAITSLDVTSSTGTLGVTGDVAPAGPDVEQPLESADLDVVVSAALARTWSDLGEFVAASGARAAGDARWEVDVSTADGTTWTVDGLGGVDALVLTLPIDDDDPTTPPTLTVAPGRAHANWAARIDTAGLDVALPMLSAGWDGLALAGTGTLENLDALGDPAAQQPARIDFTDESLVVRYVPDRVQQWFGPLLPVTLSGAEERTVRLAVSGPLRLVEGDPLATLAALALDADVELGTVTLPFVRASGSLRADVADAGLTLGSDLDVNGGTLALSLAGPLRAVASPTTVGLSWNDVGADAQVGAALDTVHPLLSSLDAGAAASGFAARLAGRIDLSYAGALLPDVLAGTLDLAGFSGDGRIDLGETRFATSPLMSDMLTRLGGTGERAFTIAPLEFSLDGGRLLYDEPWQWTMGGVTTAFTGSIAPDGALDLTWRLPITDALVQRHSFLDRMRGESIAVPLTGSLTAPRLAWDGALSDLADRALKKEFDDRVGEALPGLDLPGLTGGRRQGGDDPTALLAEADRLWDAGDVDAARAIYERLEDDFRFSLVVLANKDRIEDRAEKPKGDKKKTKKKGGKGGG